MKRLCLLLIFGCLIATGWAEVLVTQDFEGATFPPTGWSATSDYPIVYWERLTQGSNSFAYGSGELSSVEGYLDTPAISLVAGDSLTIAFDSFLNMDTSGGKVSLYQGSNLIWSDNPDRRKLSHNSFTLPTIATTGNYYVRWTIHTGPFPMSCFEVDNVAVGRNMTNNQCQVQPSSLGVIRSAYR